MSRRRSRYFVNIYYGKELGSIGEPQAKALGFKILQYVVEKIRKSEPPEKANPEGGLHTGSNGLAYTFLHLSRRFNSIGDSSKATQYFELAKNYWRVPLALAEQDDDSYDKAFLLGDSGSISVGAVLAKMAGDENRAFLLAARYRNTAMCFQPNDSDEFFVGRAGFLAGALWLNREFGGDQIIHVEIMHEIARQIVRSGKDYSRTKGCPCPLMYWYYRKEYLGAAHGLSSILHMLIQVPNFLDSDREVENTVRASVNYLLSHENLSGNYPASMDKVSRGRRVHEEDELVQWCHGAPGIVYLMAAAYLRWNDSRYLETCLRAGELVWKKGLLRKGPGICHGVAGGGYVFLLLYRLTSDNMYLQRAVKFAEFLTSEEFRKEARTPDAPYSLFEGWAGTACFLADLMEPNKAAFPFMDVFP
ncbi:lanC-like protein 3 homolog [Orussus abietinus]|uniref:lanC-like protein 3 homolog n=1 Tax=Orussus abietinus TaxID=222816 RepID=UPI0006254A2A|nr:lanC-like protein 3 homolog [Orussus abietinus]